MPSCNASPTPSLRVRYDWPQHKKRSTSAGINLCRRENSYLFNYFIIWPTNLVSLQYYKHPKRNIIWMAVPEAVVSLLGRSIHNRRCWSVLADSPCQHAWWVLEASKLCTSHCYRIQTQPSPAPKALAQRPQNYLKDTKHIESLHNKTCYCTKRCYSFKHFVYIFAPLQVCVCLASLINLSIAI